MSNPPVIGQDPWGAELNAYLASLDARLDAVEAKPEYVFNSYPWQYSPSAPPPTGSQVRFNNVNLALATTAVFRLTDSDGADRTPIFQQLTSQAKIRLNDWNNAAIIHRFNVTGPAAITASDATVPLAWTSGSGTFSNNAKANVAFLVVLM